MPARSGTKSVDLIPPSDPEQVARELVRRASGGAKPGVTVDGDPALEAVDTQNATIRQAKVDPRAFAQALEKADVDDESSSEE